MLVRILSKVISKIKGEEFILDEKLPLKYLLGLLWFQFVSLIWGMLRLHTLHPVYINPSSTIRCASMIKHGKNLRIDRKCYIDALSRNGLICGDNVSIGYSTHIELTGSLKKLGKGMIIGNNVGLGTHGHYGSGMGLLTIGNDTIFGNYVSVHPESHNYRNMATPIRAQGVSGKGVTIGKNCWIGAKVTILDGTILGDGCIVAAGAVVKGIFPAYSIIGGVPARILKTRT